MKRCLTGRRSLQSAHSAPRFVNLLFDQQHTFQKGESTDGKTSNQMSGLFETEPVRGLHTLPGHHFCGAADHCKCRRRNSNVPIPWMVCGPLKNSISVLSGIPSRA